MIITEFYLPETCVLYLEKLQNWLLIQLPVKIELRSRARIREQVNSSGGRQAGPAQLRLIEWFNTALSFILWSSIEPTETGQALFEHNQLREERPWPSNWVKW
jgi:hypothetical protein